jgi:uncharacterized membrane protein
MADIVNTVVDDQVSMFKDSLRLQFLAPNLVGVALIIVGVILLITSSHCHSKKAAAAKQSQNDVDLKPCKSQLTAGSILLAFGIVTLIVVGIILIFRHPRAALERNLLFRN